MMIKSIARWLGIATQLFALATALCAFTYTVTVGGTEGATYSDWLEVIKMTLMVYGMVLITPRILFMIPAIINMYAFKPKRFYVVMIGVSLTALTFFQMMF